ncbi:aspartate aminotransferase family protein [Paracidobacterium acidisoli]|uniref:Aminotransferase class III-fold pyridoxal phosphate-dependent enzyme n=1 Tax=Paracidobacterium acidisoli TaxID=2303751 RepID=A0A372IWE7_9BACT|nr:aminotransferase class III-fold pyridoxal phosphate-dependent enzyme [Paracidobacterium acidisoli]MBT9329886.1 aminotransferase class III-fold pyridoxal phosphate-dependent enzyme [Paracidobacterium acidisoli]
MSEISVSPNPALSTQEVVDLTRRLNYGTWRYQRDWNPLHIADAEGCYIIDGNGKRYLDLSAQLMCVNLGHKNPVVVESIAEQARRLPYIAPGHTTEVRAQLSRMLLDVMPEGLTKFFFATSGTEANEAAFKIARLSTGKSKIISRYRSYHGATMASMGATGDPRRWPAEPSVKGQGFLFAPEVNCYKCPIKHTYPQCGIACADYLEHMIENESDVAAVIVEPVVGTNGVLVPPAEYLPKLLEICRRHNVLLIADEVMSGWGRTGSWFAVDNWGVKPDILVTAKGITSAYVPLGVCATTAKVAAHFDDHLFAHGHTYEAHPITLYPAIATIQEMQRLDLVNRARSMGEYLGPKLRALKDRHPSIGEVRGLGLFWAVELVKDHVSKAPLNTRQEKMDGKPLVVDRVAADMMKRGVSVVAWISHFVIAPPLIVEKADLDFAVEVLDASLSIADEAVAG